MIPKLALPDGNELKRTVAPSRTYKLDLSSQRIAGMVDGVGAVAQMVYKVLCTERYAWLIYDWDYGMELEQYLGQNMDYVAADFHQSVIDALLVDDRIVDVHNFCFRKEQIDAVQVEFTVSSTEGKQKIAMEVPI